jgi:hypothetical protein
MNDDSRRGPPDVAALIAALESHGVRYVLTGSVAAQLYGVALEPGDLDITPALDRANLSRLAALLQAIDATPDGPPGHWEMQPNGERRWVADDPPRESSVWRPDPDDIASFDHLFRSRHGRFDVVPAISGTYNELLPRATAIEAFGRAIHVAHIDDLLATLTIPRREKDALRVRELRAIQRERGTNRNDT